jgi:hypothetical protein
MSQAIAMQPKQATALIHFELRQDAYEKLKTAFDAVRKELDDGMFGETSEWTSIRHARGKLYEMGELLKSELVIVKEDPVGEPEIAQGGAA